MASIHTDTSASHPYTCNTCQVAYRNIDLQKAHMKSDWHRYNLKRRVASLPPISADIFTEKVLQARAATTAAADKAYFERACEACDKTYYSENAYQNHLSSQKHKANELSTDNRTEDEEKSIISSTFSLGDPVPGSGGSMDSDAEDEFNHMMEGLQNTKLSAQRPSPVKRPSNPQASVGNLPTQGDADESMQRDSGATTPVQQPGADPKWTLQSCLFCNYESPTLPLNMHHMERFHGMYVPEKPYLVDLEGLVKHLQSKIGEGHECLYCGKMKATVFAIQTHMKDTGHCKIPYTSEEEQLDLGDYYDFRATYSDEEDNDEESDESSAEQNGGAKLGAKRPARIMASDGDEEVDGDVGEGWETDSSASSLDSEDLTAVPAEGHVHQFERLGKHRHHSHNDPRQRHQVDGWHSHAHKHTHAVFHDDYELHLPSGKSVGHRSLNKYYRQNLTHYPTPEERAERLALEDGDAMDTDDEDTLAGREVATRNTQRNRGMIPRGALGLSGVSDHKKEKVKKAEQRSRTQKDALEKKTDYMVGRKLNNQKNYYYRYVRGG